MMLGLLCEVCSSEVESACNPSGRLAGDKDLDDLALTCVLGFAILRSSGEDCALPMIDVYQASLCEEQHQSRDFRQQNARNPQPQST